MQFRLQPSGEGADRLTELLLRELQAGKTVLWLVTGGSSIKIAVNVMQRLRGHQKRLLVTLSDERYGKVGHADSNWQQLLEQDFNPGEATVYPVLQEGLSLQETAQSFELTLSRSFDKADIVVAQLGIGVDGHISGILPHSPAAKPTKSLVVGYETEKFDRITTTFSALKKINEGFCFVYGADKKEALVNLQNKSLALEEQPAQILKSIPSTYVYNDQIGENSDEQSATSK